MVTFACLLGYTLMDRELKHTSEIDTSTLLIICTAAQSFWERHHIGHNIIITTIVIIITAIATSVEDKYRTE